MTAKVSTVKSTPSPARLPNATLQRRRVQQRRHREDREELPDLADDARELHEERRLPLGEPDGDDAQHAREDGGIAGAEQHRGRGSPMPTSGANAMTSCPIAMRTMPIVIDRPRAEAVEQQPHRDLHRAVHGELDDREHRQRRGIRVEPHRRIDADRRERRAVRDREHVGGDADAPHQPQAPGARGREGSRHGTFTEGERVAAASGRPPAFQPNRARSDATRRERADAPAWDIRSLVGAGAVATARRPPTSASTFASRRPRARRPVGRHDLALRRPRARRRGRSPPARTASCTGASTRPSPR